MAVFLVSNEPCRHSPVTRKAFSCLHEDFTMSELVDEYHKDTSEHVKVVCGTGPLLGLEAATVSGAELKRCTVGQLSQSFGVNHFRIICEDRAQESCASKGPTASEEPPAQRSAFDVLMGASRKRGLPEKKTQRFAFLIL